MVSPQQLEQGVKPIQNYYSSLGFSRKFSFLQGSFSSIGNYNTSGSKGISGVEAKELAAKKHSEAERRRRVRINDQFSTLQTILPNLFKTDKASVLAQSIRRVRELQKLVNELKAVRQDHEVYVFPSAADGLHVQCYRNTGLLKAILSCEDKPGLMSDLSRAVRSVQGRLVKAEMVTVGGRVKCLLCVQGLKGNETMMQLKRSLNLIINKPVLRANSKKFQSSP